MGLRRPAPPASRSIGPLLLGGPVHVPRRTRIGEDAEGKRAPLVAFIQGAAGGLRAGQVHALGKALETGVRTFP